MFIPIISSLLTETDFYDNYNIENNDNGYLLEIELAGYDRDQIKIKLNSTKLIVEAERKNKKFYKLFYIDKSIDVDKIESSFKDGLLVINLPKLNQIFKDIKIN